MDRTGCGHNILGTTYLRCAICGAPPQRGRKKCRHKTTAPAEAVVFERGRLISPRSSCRQLLARPKREPQQQEYQQTEPPQRVQQPVQQAL